MSHDTVQLDIKSTLLRLARDVIRTDTRPWAQEVHTVINDYLECRLTLKGVQDAVKRVQIMPKPTRMP